MSCFVLLFFKLFLNTVELLKTRVHILSNWRSSLKDVWAALFHMKRQISESRHLEWPYLQNANTNMAAGEENTRQIHVLRCSVTVLNYRKSPVFLKLKFWIFLFLLDKHESETDFCWGSHFENCMSFCRGFVDTWPNRSWIELDLNKLRTSC